jgi:DNA repair photolyase
MKVENVELFAKGCLGTCWYGKYHYLEPWVGCGHNCPYCYGRFRSAVIHTLTKLQAKFTSPKPLYPPDELLQKIHTSANFGEINILKLCRYTDIFTPPFVKNGLSEEILRILAYSKVSRIIITTKGLPSDSIVKLITSHASKFSYNAAAKPITAATLERTLTDLDARLETASRIGRSGVLTTIHMDPFLPGFDDKTEALKPFLDKLGSLGLKRIMFSYLLLSNKIAQSIGQSIDSAVFDRIQSLYDTDLARRCLPSQEETEYWSLKAHEKHKSVEKTAALLEEMGFNYVLCSVKNTPGFDFSGLKRSRLCDGNFYA